LGVAGPEPLYVLEKDAATGTVTVGPRSALASTAVHLEETKLHRPAAEVNLVRLRYHARPLACRARPGAGGALELELGEPAESVAPGQLACLMRDECVVGEGTIRA
ncbi:MAG: aminomethyltransferase beta-barrel domain-containing protein, partial [Thermoleophilaceae bacterium]